MIDPKLVEIFEYNFGIDLTQDKYKEGLQELAEFFKGVVVTGATNFYDAQDAMRSVGSAEQDASK